jgi:hypothetical protein
MMHWTHHFVSPFKWLNISLVHYGEQLASVMNDILLVSEAAALAKEIQRSAESSMSTLRSPKGMFGWEHGTFRGLSFAFEDDGSSKASMESETGDKTVINANALDPLTGSLSEQEKGKIQQLLEEWEEPKRMVDQGEVCLWH